MFTCLVLWLGCAVLTYSSPTVASCAEEYCREKDLPRVMTGHSLLGLLFRYEDNGDQVNNLNVLVKQVGKGSITELGEPKAFLEKINYLFGDQVFTGEPFSLLPHATPCS